ncbi:CHAP domain-containing protein [Sphingobium sp. Cam5-1]|uniref:CHAP domain-containing protein n=1 Tax=Sphingobium sp. Cam5-1 TaxID=2789327 RepID=UPI0018AD2B89|nr:CHAP domain-containing protein [Sphingobium sp. Cam5-1]QPI72363.1 CHAP domain-containing protein [Sphingobium sp. Cam5-1]
MFRYVRGAAWLLAALVATPVFGATALQCVPYARIVSGVNIRGDALTWWDQAQDRYARGHVPRRGAVMTFRPYGPMTLGHVAVVSKVLDDRRVLIRHANWSVPGAIEEDVLALDVSDAGDWSQVRVWHSPTGQMGARANPTFGFIYPDKPQLHAFEPDPALGTSVRLAKTDAEDWKPTKAVIKADGEEPSLRLASLGRSLRKAVHEPKLEMDMRAMQFADAAPSGRSLRDIIADVKRDARLR